MLWLKIFSQLGLGVIIILSGGFAGLYYIVKYDNGQTIKSAIQSLEGQKNVIQKQIDSLDMELEQLQDMDKAMNLMGDEINKFLQFIPNKMTSSMVLNHLNVHAKASGVDLEKYANHNAVEKKEFYEKLGISVTVKGLFTQVLVFLSKLTGLTEIITVERFTLREVVQRGRKQIQGLGEVTMQMDIYGYRYITPIIEVAKGDNGKKGVKQ